MKTKRFLKVFITALVCMALVVPVFQVASAGGQAVTLEGNPNLYWALQDYSGGWIDLDHDNIISQEELNIFDNPSHQLNLDGISLSPNQTGKLTDISGLQYLTHITRLELANNQITDISPLGAMTQLNYLDLNHNQIADTTPLHALNLLTYLDVSHNQVTTIGALTMASGSWAYYNHNFITTPALEPLRGNGNLNFIEVNYNFMSPIDLEITSIDDSMTGEIRLGSQNQIKITLDDGAHGNSHMSGYSVYYGAQGAFIDITDLDPEYTFMGWSLDGSTLTYPYSTYYSIGHIPFPLTLPTTVNEFTHTVDLTLHAIYAHNNADLGNPGNNRGSLTYYDATSHYDIALDPWDRNVTLHPNLMEEHATFTIDGASVASKTFNCNPGIPVEVTIKVTAQDGIHTRTYTVSITRDRPQLGKLAGITYTSGTLSPAFLPLTKKYTLTLDESTSAVRITPEKGYDSDTLRPVYKDVTISKKGGTKTVTFTVRSGANPSLSTTYQVKVVRAKSATAQLQYINVNNAPVAGFDPAVLTGYTVSIPWQKSTATVKVKEMEKGSIVKIENARTNSRTFTLRHPGDTKDVHITVISPDNSTVHTYTVTIKRDHAPADATLSDIKVNGVTVTGFVPATLNYTLSVPATQRTAIIRVAVNEPHAIVKLNRVRTKVLTVPLVPGVPKVVTIVVTAADGTTISTYTVTITRSSV